MLRETQIAFADALLARDAYATCDAVARIHAGKLSATRRLEIYRHNVFANLCGGLQDIYPVVVSVVGKTFFYTAVDEFVRQHPSQSGDLNQYGGEWAAFLGAYPHAQELPYLPDVARLEWAWHQAFHAADARAFDLARLAAIPAGEHAALRFKLHPAARLIQSDFPLLRIWEVNQPAFAGDMAVDWDASGDTLLVYREVVDGVAVMIKRVTLGEHAFLRALQEHATLSAAVNSAVSVDATFELQSVLLDTVQSGVIVDCMH